MPKAATKKTPAKTSKPVKKAAVKKAPVKKAAKAVEKKGPGRPKGPIHVPDWIDVTKSGPIARKNSVDPKPGLSFAQFKAGPDGAVHLENLVALIEAQDARLLKLLK